jgi:hypothetical protein
MNQPYVVEEFLDLERAVWKALKDGDAEADALLLADDFRGVYATGVATKSDHVAQLSSGPTVSWYELSKAEIMVLAEDLVLLMYLVRWTRTASRGHSGLETMYVSSIWRRRHGTWTNVFSQDTDHRR